MASEAEAATSQDPAPAAPSFLQSIEVYGLVDGYYGWAFNEVGPALRNFDVNHNNFSLNYVEFAIAKPVTEQSRAGFRADFGAGDTADLVNLFEPGGTNYLKYVQQAYVSYLVPAGKGLTVDFGKFVTPAGAEVIESKDNFNYSRGLLFALGHPLLPHGRPLRVRGDRQCVVHRLHRQRLEQRQGQQRREDGDWIGHRQADGQADRSSAITSSARSRRITPTAARAI